MLGCALLPRKGSARAQCQQPNLWDCFDPQACKMFCEERREFVVRLFAFDRIVVVCARFHRTSHPAQSLCVLDRLETSLSSTVSRPPSNCDRCQRFMRFSGCLTGVYLLLFARAGTLQLQVPAARAAAAAAAAEVAMPVRAFVSNNLFSAGTARAGEVFSISCFAFRNTSHPVTPCHRQNVMRLVRRDLLFLAVPTMDVGLRQRKLGPFV